MDCNSASPTDTSTTEENENEHTANIVGYKGQATLTLNKVK